jgi:4'-phosphopantetheinyl transferase
MNHKRNIYYCKVNCVNLPKLLHSTKNETLDSYFDVYYGNADNSVGRIGYYESLLSEAEIMRMNNFVLENDRLTYCISHGFTRNYISEKLNLLNEEIKIEYTNDAKPKLAKVNADFNLTHSENYFGFVITNKIDGIVGIDIEKLIVMKNYTSIVLKYMHIDEKCYVLDSSLSIEEQLMRFYEIWTRKEAFLKMLGIGIVFDLTEVNMVPGVNSVVVKVPENFSVNSDQIFLNTLFTNNFVLSVSSNISSLPCFAEV